MVALFYKINNHVELSYGYRFGLMDGIFQRGNKIQLNGVTVQNHKLELRGTDFTLRAYTLIENTGNSYNLNPLAYNLDLNNGSNSVWAGKFQQELQTQVNNGTDLATAMNAGACCGRPGPGSTGHDRPSMRSKIPLPELITGIFGEYAWCASYGWSCTLATE